MMKKLITLITLCLAGTGISLAADDEPIIKGYLLFETWEGVSGSTIAGLYASPAFPDSPTSAEWRTSIEIEANRLDNYGIRARGYLIPPETGNYTFWISSDDASELWLSTDATWENTVKVAFVSSWSSERQWNKFPTEQQSAEIPLVAGQRYFIEVLFKENSGGDNLAAAWIGPGIGEDPCNPIIIQGDYLSPYIRTDDRALILRYYKAKNPSPANGSYAATANLTLTWDPVVYAASHHVYVGENQDDVANGTGSTDQGLVTQPAFSGYPFQLGKTYYWRIDEVEADGVTVYPGAVWSFTAIPMTASVPTPPDGSRFVDPNVTLGWVAGARATTHEVYIGTDQTLVTNGDAAAFKASRTTTTFVPGPLAMGIKHYWRIDEVEADGTTRHPGQVWSFTTLPAMTVSDPDLLGWWKLDESQGTLAFDFSGHGNRGTLNGGPLWTAGYDAGALDFDGKDDYVDTGKTPTTLGLNGNAPRTVSVWIYVRAFNGGGIYEMGSNRNTEDFALANRANTTNRWRMQYWNADVDFDAGAVNQWMHFTHVHDGTRSKIYLNGSVVVDVERTLNTTDGKTFKFGTYRTNRFNGLIDDLRLYRRAVSGDEIPRIMAGDPSLAWGPNPGNGSTPDADQAAVLSWSPGDGAVEHDVYLDQDQAAVAAANVTNTTGVYRGRQGTTTYTPQASLEWGGTYYWRIDEITQDGIVSEGKIWSFAVADYLVVEDYEAYDDFCNRIYWGWIDGVGHWGSGDCGVAPASGNNSGATVGNLNAPFAERTIVHGGFQSLPLEYDNSRSPFYSETVHEWPAPQDWTRHGVDSLTLSFKGNPVGFIETSPQSITMSGIGTDIWGTADQFRFAYKPLSGNGSIIARVDSLEDTDPWAKAGVMIRETLEAGSAWASVFSTGSSGVRYQARLTADVSATSDTTVAPSEQLTLHQPVWIKIERTGNDFKGYYSIDGTAWTAMSWNPQTISMATDVYIGLAVSSHNAAFPTTAQYSEISTTGNAVGTWQNLDIGATLPVPNSLEQVYVAVEDSSQRIKAVPHPDPAATTRGAWTQWTIPLSSFTAAGIDLTNVKGLIIGAGDRNTPKTGGTGKLYIDDVRLTKASNP